MFYGTLDGQVVGISFTHFFSRHCLMKFPLIEPLEARIAPATFSIATPDPISEGDSGTKDLIFKVTLTDAITADATVHFFTANGGDVATQATTLDKDYALTTGTLTFHPGGPVEQFIHVPITGDTKHEVDELFNVTLDTPVGATIASGGGTAIGTILNDDPIPTVSINDITINEGDNGTASWNFTLTLSNATSSSVSVKASTVGLTATEGVDFAHTEQTFTFLPNTTLLTRQFSVVVVGDTTPETDETFKVILSNPSASVTLGKSEGIGTILGDESVFIDSASLDQRVAEGDSGSKTIVFTVKLGKAFTDVVTVKAQTNPGTARDGIDYTAVPVQTLTFQPGETTKSFPVTIYGDLIDETNYDFFVDLSAPSANVALGPSHAKGTIVDDEVRLTVHDVSTVETNSGDTLLTFNVDLSRATDHAVTVDFATQNLTGDGAATSDGAAADYVAQNGTLTFDPGQTTKAVSVVIHGDVTAELDEHFLLKLSNSVGAFLNRDTATGTILNDETALSISDAQVLEGNANGVTQAVFTVTLANGPATGDVTVNVGTADGTATVAGNDYTALLADSNLLTFHPGETTKQVFVPVLGDTAIEANETFSVKLTGASSNVSVARDTGTGTILNDDGAAFTISDVTVTEGDFGTKNAVFLVRLLNAQTQDVTVDVATADGTATSSGAFVDFTPLAKTTLTFAKGTAQQLVTVPIAGDLIQEGTETFTVNLSNPHGLPTDPALQVTLAKSVGTGTILDNGDPAPTLNIGDAKLVEGDSGTTLMQFTATLSAASQDTVTAIYSTHDLSSAAHPATAGNDYTAANGTVTFAAGQTSVLISIPVIGDTADENDETFGITLSAPKGATLGTAEGIGTIQNDDVTVSIGDVSTLEGTGGTTIFNFHVSIDAHGATTLQHDVTVDFTTADATAISTGANADFAAKTGTLTFAAGGGLSQDVSITVNGDDRLENDEQFFVNLLSSMNATIVKKQGTGTIQNDDAVQVSIHDASFTEGKTDKGFEITLDHASDLAITVKVNTQDGTALANVSLGTPPVTTLNDFTQITDQVVTFAPGETSKFVPVAIVDDTNDEPQETFAAKLSGVSANATLGTDTATGTITDNDLRVLSVADVSVAEGDFGTKTVTFTVSLDRAAKQDVFFDFATSDNSATAGQDYVSASGTGLKIPAGSLSKTIDVTINGDTTIEGNERFFLSLSNAVNGLISSTAGQAKATIVDDETKVQLVPVNGVAFDEVSQDVEFHVVRTGDLSKAVSVQYETVDGTAQSTGAQADFLAKSGTISFAAGSKTASGTIRVHINGDNNFENAENFQLRLFNPVNAAVLDGVNQTAVESLTDLTINEDPSDVAPTLSVADVKIVEGNSGTQQMVFKVRLLGADGLPASNEKDVVTVFAETALGNDPATAANPVKPDTTKSQYFVQDYVAPAKTLLTFANGATEETFSVTINGDTRYEADETFRVLLSGEQNAKVDETHREATGTIVNDDAAPTLTFNGPSTPPVEGDSGQTTATFTVTLSAVSEIPLSVLATTHAGTAVSDGAQPDFQALDHVMESYVPGTVSKTITFPVFINGDTMNEGSETFGVTISDAVNGKIAGGTATAKTSITDIDPVPVVLVSDASIVEGNGGTTDMVFIVSLSAASGQAVDVNFASVDGTAISTGPMADYVATSGTVHFAPGETQKEVHVAVNGDTFKEHDETFSLQLKGPINATLLTAQGAVADSIAGTGTIADDGDKTVGIAIREAFKVEGNTGTSTMLFNVELSDALTTATTFNAVSTSGTALQGSDFAALGTTAFTIAANTKTATVPVTIFGDTVFEATESFFVELRNAVNAGGETVAIVGGAARGTFFNDDMRQVDSHTIQFIDVDGDLATVHVSKGVLSQNRLTFGDVNSVGGKQLQVINLTGDNAQFQDADLSVTASAQPGFRGDANGVKGDGRVNVGAIYAAIANPGILQFANGIDLGTVMIGGDLGKILAGDTAVTSGIKNLLVRSMGHFGTDTQPAATSSGTPDTISLVLGPIDYFHVVGDFESALEVVGAQFGVIRTLQIDGALLGGKTANSGEILVTGRIDNARIGSIVGGSGANSGLLLGSSSVDSQILNVHVIGDVTGGLGSNSGAISAPTIGAVKIGSLVGGAGDGSGNVLATTLDSIVLTRSLIGGAGPNSGQIFANNGIANIQILKDVQGGSGSGSGVVKSSGGITAVSVVGSLFGGDGASSGGIQAVRSIGAVRTGAVVGGHGADSGTISTTGNLLKLSIFGNVVGGSANGSGGVAVGGKLSGAFISGGIFGGDSSATNAVVKSGFVTAQRIQDLTVVGDLKSGSNGGAGLASSGTIRSGTTIGTLRIRGSVIGSEDVAAIIAAPGGTSGAAIQTLVISGRAQFAEILGGYGLSTTAANPRGFATNADAQIGIVAIGGSFQSTSIVAGASAGADGLFGTTDDFSIGGSGTTNARGTVSKIARIIIGGNVIAGTRSSGIEAQYVQSVSVHGVAFSLRAGVGNDAAPGRELAAGSKINVFELPLV